MLRHLLPLLLLLVGAAHAQPADYGETEFPNSGAAEAQEPFLRGLLMLHSFEYEDAREAFQEARRIDPNFAMAAWGEALTYNHPVWQEQDAEAARDALVRLAPTPEGRLATAPTEREKDYLHTLDVLFGEGEKEDRDFAYADAMGALSDTYPDDLDAAALYALSILGTAHEGRDFATYMQAAAVAEDVFAENPRHPGAAHYLIHAYDDPIHAPLGLRPAAVYADLAPAASHALHMPSHIYFALGMWDEGAEMNVRALEAAKMRTDARGKPLNGHGWHALYWLGYAEIQRGRTAEARRLLALASELQQGQDDRAYVPLTMRANYLVETEDWAGDVASATTDLAEEGITTVARTLFVNGWAALERGDRAAAEAALADLHERMDAEESANDGASATALELEALLARDAGDDDEALGLLEEAADFEDAMPLDFGPPFPVKPVYELWGETLLALDRPDEARDLFEEALARYPRRARSLLGLARAAMQSGDEATAQAVYAELADVWHDADEEGSALSEVQEHTAMVDR